MRVERALKRRGRTRALQAIRDHFYRGAWAHEIVDAVSAGGGYLTVDDLAGFEVREEAPVRGYFAGMELCVCGPWCQGSVILQTLQILNGFDLPSLGHNHAEYLHVLVEAVKLVFADRERFYGDPDYVTVPLESLLSSAYAARRRTLIDVSRAAPGMPSAGDPWGDTGSADQLGPADSTKRGVPAPEEARYESCRGDRSGWERFLSHVQRQQPCRSGARARLRTIDSRRTVKTRRVASGGVSSRPSATRDTDSRPGGEGWGGSVGSGLTGRRCPAPGACSVPSEPGRVRAGSASCGGGAASDQCELSAVFQSVYVPPGSVAGRGSHSDSGF